MPNYDFQCKRCDHEFEMSTPMNARQPSKCPQCGRGAAYRVFRKAVATRDSYPEGHPRKGRGTKRV
jgi:putative FmdB family regulatory protein